MVRPKLIVVAGMSGSGKSTLSQQISRQLTLSGIANVWLHEEMVDHPIRSGEFTIGSIYSKKDFQLNLADLLDRWRNLIAGMQNSEAIHVMEGCFYQSIIRYFYEVDFPEERIATFYEDLFACLKPANPLIVFLYSSNPCRTLSSVYAERGQWWKELILDPGESRWLRNRGLSDESGIYLMWEACQRLSRRIHQTIAGQGLMFDVATAERQAILGRVMAHLGLEVQPDTVDRRRTRESEANLIGIYTDPADRSATLEVRLDQQGLYCRAFWRRMPLVPIGPNRYYISSFPIQLRFDSDGETGVVEVSGNYDWPLSGRTLVRT
jgi:nucleoside-triphosphatase THEP1